MFARGVALGLKRDSVVNRAQLQSGKTAASSRKSVTVMATEATSKDSRRKHSIVVTKSTTANKKKKKKAKIVVKKSLEAAIFWSVCRAALFGLLLLGLGAAMSTLGYYKEHFATEMVENTFGNGTELVVNPWTKLQFESLSYIGPVLMGIGAFVLMIACVMTLEGRETNVEMYGGRVTSDSRTHLTASEHVNDEEGELERDGRQEDFRRQMEDAKRRKDDEADSNNNRSSNNAGTPASNNDKTKPSGRVNQCYTIDESKSASTITTTLTWSKSTGHNKCPKVDSKGRTRLKYPSASCIDVLATKTQDARALLQRFLEDESRLVEDRMNRMRRKRSMNLMQQRISLEMPAECDRLTAGNANFLVESETSIPHKCNVVAEVHRCCDDIRLTPKAVSCTSSPMWSRKAGFIPRVASSDTFSPMSINSSEYSPRGVTVDDNYSASFFTSNESRPYSAMTANNDWQTSGYRETPFTKIPRSSTGNSFESLLYVATSDDVNGNFLGGNLNNNNGDTSSLDNISFYYHCHSSMDMSSNSGIINNKFDV